MVGIKDFTMPSSCYECDLHNYHNCDLTNDDIEKYLDDSRHPNCPLVEIGTCKDCNLWCRDKAIDGACFCSSFHTYTGYDFYCADFEKRGSENG